MRLVSFHQQLCVREIREAEIVRYDPDGRSFFNINTLDDLTDAARIIAGR
jgi:hypothetical protein